MANRSTSGLRPAYNLTGNRIVELVFPNSSASAKTIFVGDVVACLAAGTVYRAAANVGVIAVGVATALYDENMVPVGAPGSTISTKYIAASDEGYVQVALALPDAVFIGEMSTYAATAIFAACDHVDTAGNTTLGTSGHTLGAAASGEQFRILGKVEEPNNAVGAYCDVYVVFGESYFGQVAGAGV